LFERPQQKGRAKLSHLSWLGLFFLAKGIETAALLLHKNIKKEKNAMSGSEELANVIRHWYSYSY
jgi:hypothetical protein